MYGSAFRLLSEFYIALWGQLDALSDEHRWVRITGEQRATRAAKDILEELRKLSHRGETLPISLEELQADLTKSAKFVDDWQRAFPGERKGLRKRIEEMQAYLQERGLAFGTLTT